MSSDPTARSWQAQIIIDASRKLGRPLKAHEERFIKKRGGFIALEMIHDTVKAAKAPELEAYLASELRGPQKAGPSSRANHRPPSRRP